MSESIEQFKLDLDHEVIRLNRFSRYFVQPFLITALVSALGGAVISLVALGSEQLLAWGVFRFVLACLVLEGVYTTIWLKQPQQRPMNKQVYRAAEIIFMVVVLRLLTWGLVGNWPTWGNVSSYLRTPIESFLDPVFTLVLFVNIGCWAWAVSVTDNFQKMALDPSEVRFFATPPRDRPKFSLPNTPFRSMVFEQFGRHWITGGVVIAFLAAVSTTNLSALRESGWPTINELHLAPGMLAWLLIYFGAGLMLLSQGRLAILNARWLFGGQEKTAAIEQNWVRQTALLVVSIGTLAAFLPLGSTNLIGRLIEVIIFYAIQIIGLAWYLIALILSLLFGSSDEPLAEEQLFETAPVEPLVMPDAAQPPPAEPGFPIFGTIFWILTLVVGVMAISFFLRERGIKFAMPKLGSFWTMLQSWWRSVWRIAAHQITDLRDAIITRLVDDEVTADHNAPWRFIRLNSLSPRQKLRYFYLSTIQRTSSGSFARWGSATPLEYAAELKEHIPQASTEIDRVTAGFLKARYDAKIISAEEVQEIESEWKKLRKIVKQL